MKLAKPLVNFKVGRANNRAESCWMEDLLLGERQRMTLSNKGCKASGVASGCQQVVINDWTIITRQS